MTSRDIHVQGEGRVIVGQRTRIGEQVTVTFHAPGTVTIGDCCTIGNGVKFICNGGDIVIGDWTALYDGCLLMSSKGLEIGEHGWFGQYSVIDGTGGLRIGRGVRVGMYSQIWSHVAAGEQIEGCTLYGTRPVVLEDDVWLVGSCIVASGVTLGRRTVALIGSNITKSYPASSVIAGIPAQAKTGFDFYKLITPDEKWGLLRRWLQEIAATEALQLEESHDVVRLIDGGAPAEERELIFARSWAQAQALTLASPHASLCVLENKSYNKRLSDLEQKVLKLLASNKARFFHSNWLADQAPPTPQA